MRSHSGGSLVANPVLVGAVTTLVVIVAVFLTYNANSGLPFVPTNELRIQIASGSALVKGNEVREGGYRIGIVTAIAPIAINGRAGQQVGAENGVDQPTIAAQLTLRLDRSAGRFPVDSTAIIRPQSALGLKYVDLVRGHSRALISDGGTLPIAQTRVPVQFDDVYRIFDQPTRVAADASLLGLGNAFIGRGTALNQTIGALPVFFSRVEGVMGNLGDRRTALGRFFGSLDRTARVIAPVAALDSQLFSDMASTFEGVSRDRSALENAIAKSPATLDVSTRSLRAQLPFLSHTARLGRYLGIATRQLRGSLPVLNETLALGAGVQRRSVSLSGNLGQALDALGRLVSTPTTNAALRGLTATVTSVNPTVRYLGPYITVCNELNYFWTFVAEQFSEGDPTGSAQRALLNSANHQSNNVGSAGSAMPANGFQPGDPMPSSGPYAVPEYLHAQPYAAAVNNNGTADCEANQRGYPTRLAKGGNPSLLVALNPHTPVNAGPVFRTFDDRNKPPAQRQLDTNHVPAGETFTRDPGGPLAAPLPETPSGPQ